MSLTSAVTHSVSHLFQTGGLQSVENMKSHVEQAAAEFLEELAQIPDQVLQQNTFRLKRRVKALYQAVSDLESPVASMLSLELECVSKAHEATGQTLHQPAPQEARREQTQQQQSLQSYTQVSP